MARNSVTVSAYVEDRRRILLKLIVENGGAGYVEDSGRRVRKFGLTCSLLSGQKRGRKEAPQAGKHLVGFRVKPQGLVGARMGDRGAQVGGA